MSFLALPKVCLLIYIQSDCLMGVRQNKTKNNETSSALKKKSSNLYYIYNQYPLKKLLEFDMNQM